MIMHKRRDIAAYFLMMDQNDPNVDYNDEGAPQPDVGAYIDESNRFVIALEYFLKTITPEMSEQELIAVTFDAARVFDSSNVSLFFKRFYQVFTGVSSGAKLGTLIILLGVVNFRDLVLDKTKSLI